MRYGAFGNRDKSRRNKFPSPPAIRTAGYLYSRRTGLYSGTPHILRGEVILFQLKMLWGHSRGSLSLLVLFNLISRIQMRKVAHFLLLFFSTTSQPQSYLAPV